MLAAAPPSLLPCLFAYFSYVEDRSLPPSVSVGGVEGVGLAGGQQTASEAHGESVGEVVSPGDQDVTPRRTSRPVDRLYETGRSIKGEGSTGIGVVRGCNCTFWKL